MKRYYLFNWDETKEVYVGECQSDEIAWEKVGTMTLDKNELWHLCSF